MIRDRKKAAIITWCDNNGPTNYGQILQGYAMQRYMESLGHEAQIIQYRRRTGKDFYKAKFECGKLNQLYELLYKLIIVEKRFDKRIYRFRKFINEYIHLSRPCYDRKDVEAATKDAKYIICGSDQIWNPIWYDPIYFLSFGRANQKRIAYAPSGVALTDEYSEGRYKKMGHHINRIDFVSMREAKAIPIMTKYTDKNIEAVLDPTLLLTRAEWDRVTAKRLVNEPYIFCYAMGSLRPHKLILRQIMKEYNAERIVYIPSNVVRDKTNGAIPYTSAGPAEFISLIKHAEAVVTDSFHGTTLSIIYQRQFYILKRIQQECYLWASSSRIEDITERLLIGDRLVSNVRDVKKKERINYRTVMSHHEAEAKKSKEFIKHALNNEL